MEIPAPARVEAEQALAAKVDAGRTPPGEMLAGGDRAHLETGQAAGHEAVADRLRQAHRDVVLARREAHDVVQLLEAADAILGRAGLAALSVAEITSEAGLGKGTFYIHFPDRAALLVELHRRFHDRLFERVVADTATMCPGPERARRRIMSFLDHSRRERAVRAMVLHARTEPDVLAEARLRNDQASRLLAEDLRALVPHPLETARLLVAATAGRDVARPRDSTSDGKGLVPLGLTPRASRSSRRPSSGAA